MKKNNELRGLRRSELLEIMLQLQTEIESLKKENESLKKKLENRTICIQQAGNIAEAALQLNGMFVSAQMAADDYLNSVRSQQGNSTAADSPDGADIS